MISDAILNRERRVETRLSILGCCPLRLQQDDQELDAIFLDVSSKGIGLLVEPSLKVDQSISVFIQDQFKWLASVRWVKRPPGLHAKGVPEFHRAGLFLVGKPDSSNKSFIETLRAFHCLDI